MLTLKRKLYNMIEHTSLTVSGNRFHVTYSIFAEADQARSIAEKACVEQTIEFPPELIQDDDIRGQVFGRIENFEAAAPNVQQVTISYAEECSAFSLPQLLNVMYGNISLFPNIRVEKFELPSTLAFVFKGPRYGRDGLRKAFRSSDGPLLMSALKPQGLSAQRLADQAYEMALGGLDIIKDDHGLANQKFSPFKERVQRACDAVRKANEMTGGGTVYAPMISGPNEGLLEQAHFAKEQGAGAFLLSPSLIGFDVARRIAEDDALALPVIGHPAMMGSYVVSPTNGFSHYAMFGQIMRLIGADVSIFPNHGGRFSFSKSECRRIIEGCADEMNHLSSIFPSPGGGMTFDNVPDMATFYGNDVMYLMGGNLHKQGLPLTESCKKLRALVEDCSSVSREN